MASNSFGQLFRITTWGESHGKAVGVVIDGCPAGIPLAEEEIYHELLLRQGGNSPYTTPRKEEEKVEIYSGVFEGLTTGAPLSLIIPNKSHDSTPYTAGKKIYRPGHANFTYLNKYGVFDYRGGGRASARETVCRVAAGVVAKKFLGQYGIETLAYIGRIGQVEADISPSSVERSMVYANPLYCPSKSCAQKMALALEEDPKDSLGGVVVFVIKNPPIGLGDPVYEKFEANLSKAMLSIPATKGFEIGCGFEAPSMRGSEHNDPFYREGGDVRPSSNHAGGTLGGITTGEPVYGKVAFKPPSSIQKPVQSVNFQGESVDYATKKGSKHDPCVAIRAVPVVEAMAALVTADALLLNRCARI